MMALPIQALQAAPALQTSSVDLGAIILALAVAWFVTYWILGGAVFAVVALLRYMRVRKTRFSCLFTLSSAAAAYGASYTGILLAGPRLRPCLRGQDQLWAAVSGIFSCTLRDILFAGAMWFFLLLLVGVLIMLLSSTMPTPRPIKSPEAARSTSVK